MIGFSTNQIVTERSSSCAVRYGIAINDSANLTNPLCHAPRIRLVLPACGSGVTGKPWLSTYGIQIIARNGPKQPLGDRS